MSQSQKKFFAINNVHRAFIRHSHASHSQGNAHTHKELRMDTDWKLSLITLYTREAGALSFGLIIKYLINLSYEKQTCDFSMLYAMYDLIHEILPYFLTIKKDEKKRLRLVPTRHFYG